MRIKVDPKDLPRILNHQKHHLPTAFLLGALSTAQKVSGQAKRKSPVNDGVFRAAWRVDIKRDMVAVRNDAPHAGIIERGARPHSVSAEGVEALREWVLKKGLIRINQPLRKGFQGPERMRPLKRSEADQFGHLVDDVVWAVVHKLEKEGQRGHFILRSLAESSQGSLQREVERQLQRLMEEESVK